MSAQNWPDNWPPLDTLRAILRSHPQGCRRGNFEHLDAKRPPGIIAIGGMGWINIRKRLLAIGVAELLPDGSLVLAKNEPKRAETRGGFTAEQITAALAEIWAENDAGDPADITAQLLAKLSPPNAEALTFSVPTPTSKPSEIPRSNVMDSETAMDILETDDVFHPDIHRLMSGGLTREEAEARKATPPPDDDGLPADV